MFRTFSPITLGVICALACYAAYATADALIKGLGPSLTVFEIGLFTTLFSILPALFSKPRDERWRDTFKLNRPALTILIAVCRTACAVLITYSFVTIPLAEAYCIVFLIPVLTTILSVIVLKEHVTIDRWALILTSFAGVLLVVRPGFRELELGHLTAFGCAVSAAVSIIALRMVSGAERRVTLFVLPGVFTLAANFVGILITGFTWPDWWLLATLLVCGVLGGLGYLLQIVAVGLAPASRVAPMQYSQIVWALVFGALFFAEVPDALGLAGLGIIVAAGLANIFADGARARIVGRWAEYRARAKGAQPEPVPVPGPPEI